MEYTGEQERALAAMKAWLRDPHKQLFRLFGYAGTGKTTLAKKIIELVDGDVGVLAFTGKAAQVLRTKGCPDATTIHRYIYNSTPTTRMLIDQLNSKLLVEKAYIRQKNPSVSDADINRHPKVQELLELLHVEKERLKQPSFSLNINSKAHDVALIVLDECSMVGEKIAFDVLSFGKKVLVLGDPAQLPPIVGCGFFTHECKPDFMLTEIHRQARDNPILELATRVRNGEPLQCGKYGNSLVMVKAAVRPEDAVEADQILVGKNKTRKACNTRVRALFNYDYSQPVNGDKLLCLKNNHTKALFNGSLWYVTQVGEQRNNTIQLDIKPETPFDVEKVQVLSTMSYFLNLKTHEGWQNLQGIEEFDYGYALTVHKAQGSQWNNLLLFDESYNVGENWWRWMYTGITRAVDSIKVVMPQ